MSEEYSVGYSEGYQAGWNAAMDATPPTDETQRLAALVRAQQITIDKLEAQTAPVHFAWMRYEADCAGDPVLVLSRSTEEGAFRVYKEPPAAQRPWVGLTDDEIIQCTPNWIGTLEDVVRAIEAKLKEKNT